jgi:hypothetical protein
LDVGGIFQLGEEGLEGLYRFIIALGIMKRCVLQLISKIIQGVELDDLFIVELSFVYKPIDVIAPFALREALPHMPFFSTSPWWAQVCWQDQDERYS